MAKTLRQRLIRLAAQHPELRSDVLPLLGAPLHRTAARNPMTLDKVAGRGPKLIDRLVNDRMSVDWAPFPSDYKYKHYQEEKGDKFEAYRQWALSELDEINEDIREVRGDILKRFIRFEKSALPALKELGLTVKLGKITFGDQGSTYVDYDAHQVVEVAYDETGGRRKFRLTVSMRDFLSVYVDNWGEFRKPTDTFVTIIGTPSGVVHRGRY